MGPRLAYLAVRPYRAYASQVQEWSVPDDLPPRTPRSRRSRHRPRSIRVAGGGLGAGTRRVVQATEPPTDSIPVWTQPDGVELTTGRAVVDLATRTGVALMATGSSAAEVVSDVLRLTAAYGLQSVHVDVTFSSLTVSYNRGPLADPLTVTRVVPGTNQDFTRLARIRVLVCDIERDSLEISDARERLDAVIRAPHPYRRWVVVSAVAVMAAGVAVNVGGGVFIVLVSMLSAAVVSRLLTRLARADVPPFFAQALGAAIPALFATAVGLSQQWVYIAGLLPSLVVASGIVVLLAGLSVVAAAQDAIEGFYVTAAARVFQVLLLTLGIVVGITVVLAVATRLGIVLAIDSSPSYVPLATQLVAVAVIAAGFAVSSYVGPRSMVLAAAAAIAGWVVNQVLVATGSSPSFSAAVAALVIGFVIQLMARRLNVSALASTTASIVPLLPGRATYEGIYQIVSGPAGSGLYQGLGTLLGAAGIGIGLAAGVTLGTYLAGLLPGQPAE
ncbi:MAG: threonine/serine exporter family protein [Actinomycetota bacterium]|nr:threonine/serine exporter family protein [Actinomycetota bacterium]